MKRKNLLPPGYYDPADYILVHKDYLARLQRLDKAKSVDAVDPHANSTGTPTTREGVSSSISESCAPPDHGAPMSETPGLSIRFVQAYNSTPDPVEERVWALVLSDPREVDVITKFDDARQFVREHPVAPPHRTAESQ